MSIEAVKDFPSSEADTVAHAAHGEARRDLACAFRWAARLGYNEGIANHFSLAVSDDGGGFLVNPYGAIGRASGRAICCWSTPTSRAIW